MVHFRSKALERTILKIWERKKLVGKFEVRWGRKGREDEGFEDPTERDVPFARLCCDLYC